MKEKRAKTAEKKEPSGPGNAEEAEQIRSVMGAQLPSLSTTSSRLSEHCFTKSNCNRGRLRLLRVLHSGVRDRRRSRLQLARKTPVIRMLRICCSAGFTQKDTAAKNDSTPFNFGFRAAENGSSAIATERTDVSGAAAKTAADDDGSLHASANGFRPMCATLEHDADAPHRMVSTPRSCGSDSFTRIFLNDR